MQPKSPGLLWDMLDAARFILSETAGIDLQTYVSDRRLRQSVERSYEILGEAARRLSTYDADTAANLPELPGVISFRNVLVHTYDAVNNQRVWQVTSELLPLLEQRLAELIETAN